MRFDKFISIITTKKPWRRCANQHILWYDIALYKSRFQKEENLEHARFSRNRGLNIQMSPYQYTDPMLKMRRSRDHIIFNMGIPILGKDGLDIETGSRWFDDECRRAKARSVGEVSTYAQQTKIILGNYETISLIDTRIETTTPIQYNKLYWFNWKIGPSRILETGRTKLQI